jgi:hypothetical protein
VLHGVNALFIVGAIASGYLVYDSRDGRRGRLGLTTDNRSLIDIHGTIAFDLFFVFVGLAVYSVKVGRSRLVRCVFNESGVQTDALVLRNFVVGEF